MHLILTSIHTHIHTQAHARSISFPTNDTSLLVKAEKANPLNRKLIICADIVSELLFLQMHYNIFQKSKYI